MLENEKQLSDQWVQRNKRALSAELWPLLDHANLKKELALLPRLLAILMQVSPFGLYLSQSIFVATRYKLAFLKDLNSGEQIQDLLPALRKVMVGGIRGSSRTPLDLVGYQSLIWRYHQEGPSLGGPLLSEQDRVPVDDLKVLRATVLDVYYRHLCALWDNSFNDLSFLYNPAKEPWMGEDGVGAPRIYQSVQSAIVFHLFGSWRTSLAIQDVPSRLQHLRLLQSHFARFSPPQSISDDWHTLCLSIMMVGFSML